MKFHLLKYFLILIYTITCTSFVYPQNFSDQNNLKKAINFYETGDLKQAEEILLKLNSSTNPKKVEFQIQVLNNLGNVYADLGKNKLALSNYHQALLIAKKSNLFLTEGQIKKNIGAVYMSLGQFTTSEQYYNQAKKIADNIHNEELKADCLNNLGTIYEQTNRIALAKRSYLNAIEIYTTLKKPANLAMVSSNLAIVYKAENKLDSCIYYNTFALTSSKLANDKWMEAAISNNLGNAFSKNDQTDKALLKINSALKLAKTIGALEIEIMCLESLSDVYFKSGNYKQAYHELKKMKTLQESFNNLSLSKEIEDLRIKYQTKEKELLNEQLRTEKKNTIVIFILLLSLLIAMFTTGWIIRRKKIEQDYQKLVNAAIIESETDTRLKVASDLHDNIGQKVAVLSMFLQKFKDEDSRLKTLIQDLGEQIRNISHSLVPEAFKLGIIKALYGLKLEIEQYGEIKVDLTCPEKAFNNYSPNENLVIFRIIQEILSNSIKHSKATKLSIDINRDSENYRVTISDNGIGFNIVHLKNSSGIGWKIIESRLSVLSGTFRVKTENPGTSITLFLPVRPNEKN